MEQLNIGVVHFGGYFAVNAMAITVGSLTTARLLGRIKPLLLMSAGAMLILLASVGYAGVMYIHGPYVWGFILPATVGSTGFAILISTGASVALSPFRVLAGSASALMATVSMLFASLVSWGVMSLWREDWLLIMIADLLLGMAVMLLLLKYKDFSNEKGINGK